MLMPDCGQKGTGPTKAKKQKSASNAVLPAATLAFFFDLLEPSGFAGRVWGSFCIGTCTGTQHCWKTAFIAGRDHNTHKAITCQTKHVIPWG